MWESHPTRLQRRKKRMPYSSRWAFPVDSSTILLLLNRWVEADLLGTLDELGMGTICFSPWHKVC
jgi:aryl-alcohol dehydrogenase-like predicted oxidoreductase